MSMRRRGGLAIVAAVACTASWTVPAAPAPVDSDVLVFAAASLKTALDDVAREWRTTTGTRPVISYAGTSTLARQIVGGAPADMFVSANREWMDLLDGKGLIRRETRRDLVGNRLVLIAHGPKAATVEIAGLGRRLRDGRLAMALVDAVPAGIYGRQALTALGIWDAVAPRVAQADNVRAALAFVARGEAPFGIVYATDAAASNAVSITAVFPPASHQPIVYPAAMTAGDAGPAAEAFFAHLFSAPARLVFRRHGFAAVE